MYYRDLHPITADKYFSHKAIQLSGERLLGKTTLLKELSKNTLIMF